MLSLGAHSGLGRGHGPDQTSEKRLGPFVGQTRINPGEREGVGTIGLSGFNAGCPPLGHVAMASPPRSSQSPQSRQP